MSLRKNIFSSPKTILCFKMMSMVLTISSPKVPTKRSNKRLPSPWSETVLRVRALSLRESRHFRISRVLIVETYVIGTYTSFRRLYRITESWLSFLPGRYFLRRIPGRIVFQARTGFRTVASRRAAAISTYQVHKMYTVSRWQRQRRRTENGDGDVLTTLHAVRSPARSGRLRSFFSACREDFRVLLISRP